jgi:hypothetical protein
MSVRTTFLPELEIARANLFADMAGRGVRLSIADFGGYRTAADTATILQYRDDDYSVYAAEERGTGRTPVAKTVWRPIAPHDQSFHSYGAAFDVDLSRLESDDIELAGAIAPGSGRRWGRAWGDDAHFELAVPLATARQRWTALEGGTDDASSDRGPSTGLVLVLVAIGLGAIALARGAGGLRDWR